MGLVGSPGPRPADGAAAGGAASVWGEAGTGEAGILFS